jgi:hypothetical protein
LVEGLDLDLPHFPPSLIKVHKQLREFLVEDEHCAILMENRGISGERVATDWAQSITGGQMSVFLPLLPPGVLTQSQAINP